MLLLLLLLLLLLHLDFIVFACFPDCQFLFFYACSSVYFTFSTIAVSLLLTHDLHVRLLRVCSINTQYSVLNFVCKTCH